jgi:hypothetical protein
MVLKSKTVMYVGVILFAAVMILGSATGAGVSLGSTSAHYENEGLGTGNQAVNLLGSNLTAKIVAKSGEIISGQVNATGYDFGIYIGPGVTNVLIYHAHVFGANDQGVIATDTQNIMVMYSNISGNEVNPNKGIPLTGGIGFYGVSNSYIVGNTVTYDAAGGIVVANTGRVPTGLPYPQPNMSANNNLIADNLVEYDANACGIVIVAFNAGPGNEVANNFVFNNTVIGSLQLANGTFTGPYVGTIVVAADLPGTLVKDTLVVDNYVKGGLESGILANAQAPFAVNTGTEIVMNTIIMGGFQKVNFPPFDNASDMNLPPSSNAIGIYGNYQPGMPQSPVVSDVSVLYNTIVDNSIGIWTANSYGDVYIGNTFTNVTTDFASFYGVG